MNLIDRVLFQCKLNPPALALGAPGTDFELVSYARLERSINNVARRAISLGLAPGNLVAVFVHEPVLHAILILGLMRLGIVTVTGRSPQLPRELPVDVLITDITFPYQAKRVILADPGWTLGEDAPLANDYVPAVKPDDVCRLVLTSGTTGESKVVAFTHRNMSGRLARHQYVFGNILPNCARTFCDIGFAAGLGFQFMLYALSRGGAVFFAGADLESAVAAFEPYRIQNITTAPGSLAKLLEVYERRSSLHSSIEMIHSGGSALSKSLSERVRARICTNLIDSYGTTETSMVATAPAEAVAGLPGAVGYVLPDMLVEIVDQSGKTLPVGKEGVLRIRGPYNVDEYYCDPTGSAIVFRDGWFYPGDTGYVTPEKLLVITGREKTVLNLGGAKVKPELVEEVLASFSGIEQAGAFSAPDELGNDVLCAAVVAHGAIDVQALRAHCQSKLPPDFVPVGIVKVPELPRNAAGKIDRSRLSKFAKPMLNQGGSR